MTVSASKSRRTSALSRAKACSSVLTFGITVGCILHSCKNTQHFEITLDGEVISLITANVGRERRGVERNVLNIKNVFIYASLVHLHITFHLIMTQGSHCIMPKYEQALIYLQGATY